MGFALEYDSDLAETLMPNRFGRLNDTMQTSDRLIVVMCLEVFVEVLQVFRDMLIRCI